MEGLKTTLLLLNSIVHAVPSVAVAFVEGVLLGCAVTKKPGNARLSSLIGRMRRSNNNQRLKNTSVAIGTVLL